MLAREPMSGSQSGMLERWLPDEAATVLLGEDIAAALRPGDCVALGGDLGAGKSTLARAIIRAIADDDGLDVPSPTFTLVQGYDLRLAVHHFDLYRLGGAGEVDELGIEEALRDGIALIEWAERAGDALPGVSIRIDLADRDGGRQATLAGPGDALARLKRSLALRDFLAGAGYAQARRRHFSGDASTRRYEEIRLDGQPSRFLMDAPRQPDGPPIRDGKPYSQIAHLAECVVPFVAIAQTLGMAGLAAPAILASDLDQGMLLIEDLGRQGILKEDGAPDPERYCAAAALLAFMHDRDWPPHIALPAGDTYAVPLYDRDAMAIETELLTDWYIPYGLGREATAQERQDYRNHWGGLFDRLETAEKSLVLRDFHSPNIIWRADREGIDRLGLIDFQDALIGPAAYDVASLAMDARVTVPVELERRIVDAYCSARQSADFDRAAFDEAYAIMAAQRNSKIVGIFVRLDRRDGKPGYLRHLPRIRDYLARSLAHPALADLRSFYVRMGVLEGDTA